MSLELLQSINDSLRNQDFKEVDKILSDVKTEEDVLSFHDDVFKTITCFSDYDKIKTPILECQDFMRLIGKIYNQLLNNAFVSLYKITTKHERVSVFSRVEEKAIREYKKSNKERDDLECLMIFDLFILNQINDGLFGGDFSLVDEILMLTQEANINQAEKKEILQKWLIEYPLESAQEYHLTILSPYLKYEEFISLMTKIINRISQNDFKSVKDVL